MVNDGESSSRFFTVNLSQNIAIASPKQSNVFFTIKSEMLAKKTITTLLFARKWKYQTIGGKGFIKNCNKLLCYFCTKMRPARLLVPLLLSTLTTNGLTEETELLCKQNAISAGRAVERDLLITMSEDNLRGTFSTICDAGLQCKRHCQVASLQSDYFEFREVCRLTLV